mmetsp:Transcript_3301/g.4560  ORF Transcript_3301/g.4560 Transcript_3301/m.4560 type:complete len:279 (+) Transcript_3301:123-959(+)
MAAVSLLVKDIYEWFKKTDFVRKQSIRSEMQLEVTLINYLKDGKGYFSPNKNLEDSLMDLFETALCEGGLYVFGSPSHTGKSVYLQEYLNAFRRKRKDKTYIAVVTFSDEEINMKSFQALLKIPFGRKLSDFLPKGSLIVIDQFNLQHLSEGLKLFFTELATASFNSKDFGVIVSVSSPAVYDDILKCNYGQKIFPACDPKLLQYNEDMMFQFAKEVQPNWHIDKITDAVESCKKYRSVGVLRQVLLSKRNVLNNKIEVKWNDFEKHYDSFVDASRDE